MVGGWSISQELADYLIQNFDVVLELGSGEGSQYLVDHGLEVHSIEDDFRFINKYDTDYIHARLVGGWYDTDIIRRNIEGIKYDCILVDGPKGSVNRVRFLDNLDLFDLGKTIIIDDCHREPEYEMAEEVSYILNRSVKFVECEDGKKFAII